MATVEDLLYLQSWQDPRDEGLLRTTGLRIANVIIIAILFSGCWYYASPWMDFFLDWPLVNTFVLLTGLLRLLNAVDALHPPVLQQRTAVAAFIAAVSVHVVCGWKHVLLSLTHKQLLYLNTPVFRELNILTLTWLNKDSTDSVVITDLLLELLRIAVFFKPITSIKIFVSYVLLRNGALYLEELSGQHFIQKCLRQLGRGILFSAEVVIGLLLRTKDALSNLVEKWESFAARHAQRHAAELPPIRLSRLNDRHIRLLRVWRVAPFWDLRCAIVTVSVDFPPAYEAVSHAWEYPVTYQPVQVNNHYKMNVPSKIYRYLLHRQAYFRPLYLWVDCLCINQDDAKERAAQVCMMKDIFGRATRVVVWLAAPEEAPDARFVRNHIWMLKFAHEWFKDPIKVANLTAGKSEALRVALQRLFRSRWFTRRWMVQEVALPPKVHIMYGSCCIDWDHLAIFAIQITDPRFTRSYQELIGPHDPQRVVAFSNASTIAITRLAVQWLRISPNLEDNVPHSEAVVRDQLSLAELLTATSQFDTTDLRDKIFSLLGLVEDPDAVLPRPDYESPFRDIYLLTAKLLLFHGPTTQVSLSFAGVGLRRHCRDFSFDSAPSWVADHLSPIGQLCAVRRGREVVAVEPVVESWDDGNAARVQARMHGRIQRLGPLMEYANAAAPVNPLLPQAFNAFPAHTALNWLHSAASFAAQGWADHGFPHATKAQPLLPDHQSVLWKTLLTDFFANECPLSPATLRAVIQWHRNWKKVEIGRMPDTGGQAFIDMTDRVTFALYSTSMGRRLAFTDAGHLTLVPPLTRVGDLVYFIRHDHQPYLLREASKCGEEERFLLVGAAYAHGLPYPGDNGALYQWTVLV